MPPSPKPLRPSTSSARTSPFPLLYRLFFLYLEPLSALAGAYAAAFHPRQYLSMTHAPSAAPSSAPLPVATSTALLQLANLYLLFALNEALVLRAAPADRRVWTTLLFGLLVADVGHLASLWRLDAGVYVRFWEWNAMAWGNLGVVYVGAGMRVAFLAGAGVG